MAERRLRQGVALMVLAGLLVGGSLLGAQAQAHDDLAALNRQVSRLQSQGKYAEALPVIERYVALARRRHGEKHSEFATAIAWLAIVYQAQGRTAEAEPLYRRALAITEKALGSEHPNVGIALNNLAELYRAQGRYGEAEPLYRRALAIAEKTLSPEHPDVGGKLNNLAGLYRAQGRHGEAEPLYRRSLAIREKAVGPEHPDVAQALSNLALVQRGQGQYVEAEPLYRRAVSIYEKAHGLEHPQVATALSYLAFLYRDQGRFAEAEALLRRSLAIREKAAGPEHRDVAQALSNLAELYRVQGRYAEAEPLYRRSLAINEKAAGPEVAAALNNLAALYLDQGRYAEAEPLFRRAVSIHEKALGLEHSDVGQALNNLGALYREQGRYAEAEPLFLRAVPIYEKALGPEHPNVAVSLNNLAKLHFAQRDWASAADFWRRSTSLIARRVQRRTHDIGQAVTGKRKSEAEQLSGYFWSLVRVVHRLASEGRGHESSMLREMFETAQWAQSSEAAASLAQMAAREAKGDRALARLVRQRQDLVAEWQKREGARSAAFAQAPDKRDRPAEVANVAGLAAIDTQIAEIDKRLGVDFADYAALASPAPLSVEDVQAQLGAAEALVLFLDTPAARPLPEETFIWVVTKTDSRWVRSDLGTPALKREVAALRCGLDHALWTGADSRDRCIETLKGSRPAQEDIDGHMVDVLPFDLERAHALYTGLLGRVEDLINGKHLLVVPSGPLTSLPFHVLVTEPANTRTPRTLAEYLEVAWLGTRQPITVLPSVASLKALRQFAKTSRASKAYLGIGNPLLDGPQSDPQWGAYYRQLAGAARDSQQCGHKATTQIVLARGPRPAHDFAKLFRGGQADIDEVRSWAPLPETADELCEVGRRLNAPQSDILLGSRATEAVLRDLSESGRLIDYAILHFATHGALTGQVQGLAEPGLILTPPPQGAPERQTLDSDDGFLTASEIATLKLDADWVILSACNTAGASGETAEPLSGLARAFFYAGARALLVSHWEVGSDAAVKLTTRAFAELKSNPGIGRAEAFRISMRELLQKGTASEAHPSQWAPFVVVGEGASVK